MSQEEEKFWRCIIENLQEVITVAAIAEAVGVEDRQVWRWKAGERVPRGMQALDLNALHVKLCPNRQCRIGHSEDEREGVYRGT
jgi:hypothetical protein